MVDKKNLIRRVGYMAWFGLCLGWDGIVGRDLVWFLLLVGSGFWAGRDA